MADSYHHALSSARKYGGMPEDFLPAHQFLDSSKFATCDFRHRVAFHHSVGIDLCVRIIGPTITTSSGRQIPTRWIAEQHVKEDFGWIPSLEHWIRAIKPEPWMGRVPRIPYLHQSAEPTLQKSEDKPISE
jgi:hypothetical protein